MTAMPGVTGPQLSNKMQQVSSGNAHSTLGLKLTIMARLWFKTRHGAGASRTSRPRSSCSFSVWRFSRGNKAMAPAYMMEASTSGVTPSMNRSAAMALEP